MAGAGFLDGFGFETLIAPCDRGEFFREHWNRKPLFESRGLRDFYGGLPGLAEIDAVLARLARDADGGRDDAGDINAALRRLAQGTPLVLDNVERQMPEWALVCRVVHADLGFPSTARIEISLASNRPHLDAAEDSHRFVLQLSGRREWEVPALGASGEVELAAGDLLYLPPGCLCQHRSAGEVSVVAVISMKPMRWVDMTGDEALAAHDALPDDLAEELPPGWLKTGRDRLVEELSRRWRQAEDVMSVEDRVAQTIVAEIRRFPLDLEGRLIETVHPTAIGENAVFGSRNDLLWSIEPEGNGARLVTGVLTIDLSAESIDAARYCLSSERYSRAEVSERVAAGDVAGLLEILSRNRLIRKISG